MGLLLLAAPDQDGCAPKLSRRSRSRVAGSTRLTQLLLDDDGVVNRKTAASILGWRSGPQPALLPSARPILRRSDTGLREVMGVDWKLQFVDPTTGKQWPDSFRKASCSGVYSSSKFMAKRWLLLGVGGGVSIGSRFTPCMSRL